MGTQTKSQATTAMYRITEQQKQQALKTRNARRSKLPTVNELYPHLKVYKGCWVTMLLRADGSWSVIGTPVAHKPGEYAARLKVTAIYKDAQKLLSLLRQQIAQEASDE